MRQVGRIYHAISCLAVILLSCSAIHSEPLRITENLRKELVLLPALAPDRNQLKRLSLINIESESTVISFLASYDDPNTAWTLDYLEIYDASGGLLLIGWVDGYGIRRLAIDSGLLRGQGSELDRVMVLIADGTPL